MENKKKKANLLEKITFFTGLLILCSLIVYLVFQSGAKENQPPMLEIVTSYEASLPHYTFKVETTNQGQEAASSVNIGFNLYQDGKIAESAVLEIDYVPMRSKEHGWITFLKKRKPSDSLVIASMTFIKP